MALRSNQSNKYMWSLIDRLAEKQGKEYMDVYKDMIHKYGKFIWVLVQEKNVNDFILEWTAHGSGWYAEKVKPKSNGIACRCYRGTSMYQVDEMQKFIESIQSECKQYGIETMTPAELAELIGVQNG